MQVFCKYCEELDKFLNEVVEYVLQIYGDELIHILDWCKYPDIYKHAFEMEEARKFLPALFWLEYIAEV